MSQENESLAEKEEEQASQHHLEQTIQMVSAALGEFRSDMQRIDVSAEKIGQRTNRIIRGAIAILAVAFAYVFFQVVQLTATMVDMIGSLNTMYTRFGGMSEDMNAITKAVVSMGNHVQGMPSIADNMKNMNHSVQGMQKSVFGMKNDMGRMDQQIGMIYADTAQMAGRFANLTQSVSHLNYNVWQMSRPTEMLGPLNWFAPP
ncbi:MAG: hypothetical protein HQM06_14900 [Magnetococcales bacterium]|nr:hypothetical protein [Magnetococcales bacterium]